MNSILASQIRHCLSYLAGLGGMLLAWNLIAPEQVAAVNEAAGQLVAPLAVILGAIAAGLVRLAIGFLTNKFSGGTGKPGASVAGWLGLVGILAGFVSSLSGCSQPLGIPIRTCVITDYGTACYSSKSGIAVAVNGQAIIDRNSRK